MRCALAALEFVNNAAEQNLMTILEAMQQYAGRADLILFGEAFLQGFDAANFDPAHDRAVAITLDSPAVRRLREAAHRHHIAVSFGFIEQDGSDFYSSQLTISAAGDIADHYRRVSPGWKLPHAGDCYREGDGFHTFMLCGMRLAVGLCGDLWYDENIDALRRLAPDVVLWPVYTDFTPEEWNASERLEYAAQAGRLSADVLYVNSVCRDEGIEGKAMGGAAHFHSGRIAADIPSEEPGILLVDIP